MSEHHNGEDRILPKQEEPQDNDEVQISSNENNDVDQIPLNKNPVED